MNQIFKRRNVNCLLQPYEILATGRDCGLIEFIYYPLSIDYIRKKMKEKYRNRNLDLFDYFRKNFGHPKSKSFKAA